MNKKILERKFCVAPMMGYTTPYARNLYRILSKKTFLFTEMIASKTMMHSKNKNLIVQNDKQNPIALQVGGAEPEDLAKWAKTASLLNYDEINLNVGCPSKSVQKGKLGACLMKEKQLVKDCLNGMINSTNITVSLKCRIGIDDQVTYDFFRSFIDYIIKSEIKIIYVHARGAILKGLSPKNNRTIPPLKYEFVSKIKKDYPQIQFILNGGIDTLEKAYQYSIKYNDIMVGRLIQTNPFCLLKVDKMFFNENNKFNSYQKIVLEYFDYIKSSILF